MKDLLCLFEFFMFMALGLIKVSKRDIFYPHIHFAEDVN